MPATQKTDTETTKLVRDLGGKARSAAALLAQGSETQINDTLSAIAVKLHAGQEAILAANEKDVAAARLKNLSPALIDRLKLNAERIGGMAKGLEIVRALPDPVGRVLWETTRPNGMKIERVSVPIGVLGMIYESRPNVTVDAAALCLKSRNAVILRGGSESLHSSLALHKIIQQALKENGLPMDAVTMIPTADRDAVGAMLAAHDLIDVMIPRGGKSLVARVQAEAKMPVFSHLEG
ncbi:MAG: aldehyde dehydrogenase family protein, partial [Alphaproteobacteria bacterium]